MNGSLNRSLLIRTTLATAAVLLVAGTLLYYLLTADLRAQVDDALLGKARLLASTVEQGPLGFEVEFDDLEMGEFLSPDGPGYLELQTAAGELLYRSPSLADSPLPHDAAVTGGPVFRSISLPTGRSGRGVCLTFTPRLEDDARSEHSAAATTGAAHVSLALARTTEFTDRVLARFRLLLGGLLLVTLAILTLSLTWAVKSGIRPIARLAADIERIGERDLATRLSGAAVPVEIQPVVRRLNDLLARLEEAFAREKAFSADAAHELRTPLAGLQSVLEVTLARPRSGAEYRAALEECLQVSGHLRYLVTNLLSLARIESGAVELDAQEISLSAAVKGAWKDFEAMAAARGLSMDWELAADAHLTTDPVLLDAVLRNLIDNAVCYTDEGGQITVGTRREADRLLLSVMNTGCTLTQETAEALCGRFRRGDEARTATGTHGGLGLFLVRRILRLLHGEMRVMAVPGGEYEVCLLLPDLLRPAPDPQRLRAL